MQIPSISDTARGRLTAFMHALVNQNAASPVVLPEQSLSGYWFGGGNIIQDADGSLLLVGRYRSKGDSRTGLNAGTRGRELTLFRSVDAGRTFVKEACWDKAALSRPDASVLSIEGSCLTTHGGEYRLYVSSEKDRAYPDALRPYQKPGAGVWSIDVLRGNSLQALNGAAVEPVLSETDPSFLHLKDPFVWNDSEDAEVNSFRLGFCSHPFSWTSSNTGVATLDGTGCCVKSLQQEVIPRGTTWDVAMTRATSVLPVPRVGLFAERPHTIVFYCGGECLRQLDEHGTAVNRPRGYSCEELGGAVVYVDHDVTTAVRLSDIEPLFVSPWGTGCSRYVDVLSTVDCFLTSWQQSQHDQSQPLVLNSLARKDAEALLS